MEALALLSKATANIEALSTSRKKMADFFIFFIPIHYFLSPGVPGVAGMA
jgi:hypothetical protein